VNNISTNLGLAARDETPAGRDARRAGRSARPRVRQGEDAMSNAPGQSARSRACLYPRRPQNSTSCSAKKLPARPDPQARPPPFFHGENRGSNPLGSANQNNGLYRISQLLLFPSPIFLQINSWIRRTGLLRVLVPPIS